MLIRNSHASIGIAFGFWSESRDLQAVWYRWFLGVFVFGCFRAFSRRKFLGGGGLTKRYWAKKIQTNTGDKFSNRFKSFTTQRYGGGGCLRKDTSARFGRGKFWGRVFVFSFFGVFERFHVASFSGAEV